MGDRIESSVLHGLKLGESSKPVSLWVGFLANVPLPKASAVWYFREDEMQPTNHITQTNTFVSFAWRLFSFALCALLLLGEIFPVAAQTPRMTMAKASTAGVNGPAPAALPVATASSGAPGFADGSVLWIPDEADGRTASIAWGDMDGDGDLDLAVAKSSNPIYTYPADSLYPYFSQVYENTGQGQMRLAWQSPVESAAVSIAWGDADGDGDLDLAVGSGYNNWSSRATQLYLNNGGTPISFTVINLGEEDYRPVTSVAWGDADGDGDLDLAVGNFGQPNQLFVNQGGAQGRTIGTFIAHDIGSSRYTTSVAWGDADGDGDLDLAVGNGECGYYLYGISDYRMFWCISGQTNQLYVNQGGTQGGTSGVLIAHNLDGSAYQTTSLDWGDADSDGDLDLAVGNWNGRNQLYVNNGSGVFIAQDFFTETRYTTSVSWGDADSDGDLDLAVANHAPFNSNCGWCQGLDVNRIYLNQGGNSFVAQNVGTYMSDNLDVAWGDADSDGDLDLAVGAGYYRLNTIYENQGAVRFTTETIGTSISTASIAWGDADSDGDLDLALGHDSPNEVYANDGQGHFSLAWTAPTARNTWSVAWGDADSDGDLDLAASSWSDQVNQLYRNDGHSNFSVQDMDTSNILADNASLAWGDVDGDSDLDLAVGIWGWSGEHNLLDVNQGGLQGGMPGVFSMQMLEKVLERANSVVWGDVDNDGDLDLAIAHEKVLQLYINEGGQLHLVWGSPSGAGASSLAWGDYDGDGDLDLAVGRPLFNRVYENVGGALQFDPFNGIGWQSPDMHDTSSVAWGDMEGDGDLDLAVSNRNYPMQVYVNDGQGNLTVQDVVTETQSMGSAAWGDADGDGDLDLVVAISGAKSRLYRNRRDGNGLPGSIPTVRITRPGRTPEANLYATAEILSQMVIPFTYTLTAPQATTVSTIRASYSPDGGGKWLPAIAASGTITTNLSATPTGATHVFRWDTFVSGLFGQSDNVVLRIEAIPAIVTHANQIPGPYLYGRYATQSFPFRVRGTQIRVLNGNQPAGNALVYQLPAGQPNGAEIIADNTGDAFRTDGQGYLAGRSMLKPGDGLMALLPITTTEKYTVYATSAIPTANGLNMDTVTVGGVQTLTVSANNPLLVFNLSISLEWDARNDTVYLEQLQYDLRRTAEILYDWTNGQATLGEITIYHQRENWETADIQIFANNRYNPNADQGGLVSQIITETLIIGGVSREITYDTGQLRQGVTWNRFGEATGSLGEDWPRAMAHELGHYLLYLDDNYYGFDANGNFTPVTSCASAMSDPYTTDKASGYDEFHLASGWSATCTDTASNRNTGRADWATVAKFYPWLRAPATNFSGPSVLPLDIVQFTLVTPAAATQTLPSPYFSLLKAEGGSYAATTRAQNILIQDGRLIDLGGVPLDQLLARGAQPGDRLCMFDLSVNRLGCKNITTDDNQVLTIASHPEWQPDILIHPVTSTTLQITITVAGAIPQSVAVYAQLYPADGQAEPAVQLNRVSSTLFSASYPLSAPAPDATLHVWAGTGAAQLDATSSYSLGGNPVRRKRKPVRRKRKPAPVVSSDGNTVLHGENLEFAPGEFYILQTATRPPAPPAWASVVGQTYRLDASPKAPSLAGTSLQFYYLRREVPSGEESFLRVYFYDGQTWTPLPTRLDASGLAPYAVAETQGPGLYALMSTIEIPLDTGWNLISYPVPGSRSVTETLQSIEGAYNLVYGYDSTDLDAPWKLYSPGAPTWVNTLHEFQFGKGYWLHTAQATTLYLKGGFGLKLTAPTNAQTTFPPPSTFYGQVLAGEGYTPAPGQTLTAWIGSQACGQAQTQIIGGQIVYVISVFGDDDGAHAGCGTLNAETQFKLAALDFSPTTLWRNDVLTLLNLAPAVPPDWQLFLPIIVR
jgi:hypothetical protein